jgi:hypothetical protein
MPFAPGERQAKSFFGSIDHRIGFSDFGNLDPPPRLSWQGLGVSKGLRVTLGLYNVRTGIRVQSHSNLSSSLPRLMR